MARKLFNVCIVLALVLGCSGGVLAAAACPHLGCQTAAREDDRAESQGGHGHEAAGPQKHSGRAASQTDGHAAANPPSCHDRQRESAEPSNAAFASPPQSCAHCVGNREAPPARGFEWQTSFARDNRSEAAPRDFGRLLAPSVLFVREIIPATHAPPGSSARYLLLNVFRI